MYQYKILNPGGNKTALVLTDDFSKEEKAEINRRILQKHPYCEQVGFLNFHKKSLYMAGGEFCVNASRCAAYCFLEGKKGEVEMEVSGAKGKIRAGIKADSAAYAIMPVNREISRIVSHTPKFDRVDLDGISFIFPKNTEDCLALLNRAEEEFMSYAGEILRSVYNGEKALGMILVHGNEGKTRIEPIVWVKETDTMYHETACGSGSLATCIYLNRAKEKLYQPSGTPLEVALKLNEGTILSGEISGIMSCEGEVLTEK